MTVIKVSFKKFFLMGAVVAIIAMIIWLIPSVFIGSINGKIDMMELKGSSLTEAEQQYLVDLYWTSIWWETQQATIFNPIALIMFAIGIVIMLYGIMAKLNI